MKLAFITKLCERFLLLVVLYSFSMTPGYAAVKSDRSLSTTTKSNCLRAIAIVEAAVDAHGTLSIDGDAPRLTFTFSGVHHYAGDYTAPSVVREVDIFGEIDIAAEMTHANYTYWYDKEKMQHIIVNGERVVRYDSYKDEQSSQISHKFRRDNNSRDLDVVHHLLPQSMISQALAVRESLRYLGEETIDGQVHDVVSYPGANGVQISLLVNRESQLVSRVEEIKSNFGRGDVTQWYDYSKWYKVENLTLPGHFESRKLARNSFKKFELDFDNYNLKNEWTSDPYYLPNEVAAEVDGWIVRAPDGTPPVAKYWGWDSGQPNEISEGHVSVSKVGEDLYLMRMPRMDSQIMFYEFDDHIVVFEAPINSATGRLVISTIKEQTDKPIRYVVSSHHHEHYIGGLRPFIHDGTKIIATKENSEYVKLIARWPHNLAPDELQSSGKAPIFKIINKNLILEDNNHRVEIFDVGPGNGHTDEYLVYCFPKSKIMFNGDLVVFKNSGIIPKASSRSRSLYNLIKNENLDVEWIYNSWPITGGYSRRGTLDELAQRIGIEDSD